jgi:DNA-directed RNA polymerase specialized sigma24 family protein
MCKRILSQSTTDANEATHEAFVKVWLNRATYTPDRRVRPWLKAIAFATCMDHLRIRGRLREVPINDAKSADSPRLLRSLKSPGKDPNHGAFMVELKEGFSHCWKLLPGHQRALLQLIDWSDWKGSWTWLASATGRTPAAVRMATIRYIRGLLNCLKVIGFEPNPSELLELLEQRFSEVENTEEGKQ